MDTNHQRVISICEHLLEACIVEQDKSTLAQFGTGKQILFVSRDELPLDSNQDNVNQIKLLIIQRLERELDGIRYCIGLYNRCFDPPSKCNKQLWDTLSTASQRAVAFSIVQILIDATSNQKTHDLFSVYSQESSGDIGTFLNSVSGWSTDGTVIPSPLLKSIMEHASTTVDGQRAVVVVLQSAMKDIKNIRLDEILTTGSQLFGSLQCLLNEVSVLEIVGNKLLQEVIDGAQNFGNYYEKETVFGSLLSVSIFIDKLTPSVLRNLQYSSYINLRGFPKPFSSDLSQLNSSIQDSVHKCISFLHSTLLQLLKRPTSKNNVLSWFAAVVTCNEMRAGPKYEIKKGQSTASDGFLVNFCSMLLAFCRPFFSYAPSAPKLPLIVPDYPSSVHCRLDLHNEPCLANGLISSGDDQSKQRHVRFLCTEGNFKFVTECFFITLRALHIGLLPITETYLSTLSDLAKEIDRKGGQDKLLNDLNGLYLYSGDCCLLDPQLVQNCSEFYVTNAVWLTMLMESCYKDGLSEQEIHLNQQKMFSKIPEHYVKDMVRWFLFVLRTRPKLLQGLQLTPFVDCCISLLERPDILSGPVAQSQIISVLLACIGRDTNQKLLSTDTWGGIHGELSAMVQGSPTFQDRLGPALLHTYSAVGVVEGLDVDKENFDKYTARYDITQLLIYLWSRLDCRESIVKQSGTKRFELFLQAVFDTLLYQLNDGFTRIANIQKMEAEKTNESFLTREQRAARVLINMGSKLLDMLELMTELESISKHLFTVPLSIRTSSAIMGFLDVLCGARQSELKIKDPEKIQFDPRKIVSQLATIIAHIWQYENMNDLLENGFTISLVNHPDYNYSVVSKVLSILERHQLTNGHIITSYKSFIEQVHKLTGGPGDPLSQAAAIVGQASTATSHSTVADWQTQIETTVVDKTVIHEMYQGALAEAVYDTVTLQGVHSLEDKATVTNLDPRSPRLRAILRDVKQLQESLSIHPDSSIFVKQDEDRMDLVRVLITGPVDTPYSYGCFIFDIYYPTNYPVTPPLVLLTTTGNGTIRFNPNLYADGKVCLSLLGTWHGGDSSEKWDPLQSNLLQVLVSIQGLILIPEPIYNEPGYEAMQGTPQGKLRSSQYNAYIQINTVRYAMLEQLKHPPAGFEDIIRIHFMLLKDSILYQCSKWLRQTVSNDHQLKLRKAIDELRTEFDKL